MTTFHSKKKAELTFYLGINENCEHCASALEQLGKLDTVKTDFYGCVDRNTGARAPTFIMKPDYNSHGNLTHWHIELNEEGE